MSPAAGPRHMRPPAAPPGMPALLGRLGPGDHGLVFGPSQLTPVFVEALLQRARDLRFQLIVAHPKLPEVELARVAALVRGGPDAIAQGELTMLDAPAFVALRRAVARQGAKGLEPLEVVAARLGFEGALVVVAHADPLDPEAVAMEAALAARIGPKLAVQCLYPSPPAARDQALRLLRAHTPGRMVMPAVWRLAEQAAPPPAAADEGRSPVLA